MTEALVSSRAVYDPAVYDPAVVLADLQSSVRPEVEPRVVRFNLRPLLHNLEKPHA